MESTTNVVRSPPEAVDRLRAAGTIILASPEFQHLLLDAGARVLAQLQLAQRG